MQLNQFRYPREVRAADADGAGVLSCQTLVKVRYPFAVAEQDTRLTGSRLWIIWSLPVSLTHGRRWPGDAPLTRTLLGTGATRSAAWASAAHPLRCLLGG